MKPKLTLITDYSKGNILWGGLTPGVLRTPWGLAATVLTETPAFLLHVTEGDGSWRPTLSGPIIRAPLLLTEPDGRLHIVCAGIHWRAKDAGPDSEFAVDALPPECGAMIYVGAAMNERGDLLLVFPHNRPIEDEQRTLYSALLPRGERRWIVRRIFELPFRHCYPTIHFRGDAAHVVVTGDIIERGPQFRWRQSSGYRYRLCSLTHLSTPDVYSGAWEARQFETYDDGWIFGTDIHAADDGSVHVLGYGTRRTLNIENPDEPLPDGAVMHWSTPKAGEPFGCQVIAQQTGASKSRFAPDGRGGWRYLMNFRGEVRPHPASAQDEVASLRFARTNGWGQQPQVSELELGGVLPLSGVLARPQRFGGVSSPGTFDILISDPWAHTNPEHFNYTNPTWDAWHAELDISDDKAR